MCHPEVPAGEPTPDVERREVLVPVAGGEEMPALLTVPENGRGAGVLIVNDVFGRSPFYESLAARLATAGFHAVVPEFFFREGPLEERTMPAAMERRARLDENRTLRDLAATIDWLGRQEGIAGERTGTIGFCMGGTMVLDLAAERDDVATVCFYGFPAGAHAPTDKSAPRPLDRLDDISGPILGFWGDQDANVGMDNVAALAKGLTDRGVDFEHTVYPGLGHGFLAASQLDPDHQAYEAACDAWTRTVDFYRTHL
jgi:carboxymethylenebutenolidase